MCPSSPQTQLASLPDDAILWNLPSTDWTVEQFRHVAELPSAWDLLATASGDMFLQRPYLSVLETNPFAGMVPGYLVFYYQQQAVGIAILQYVTFDGGVQIQDKGKYNGLMDRLRSGVASLARFDIVVCGALQLTGQHAYFFRSDIEPEVALRQLSDGLRTIEQRKEVGLRPVQASLVKDIPADTEIVGQLLADDRYNTLEFQPSMDLVMRPHWMTFADYLMDLQSKNRVRVRRALKKADDIYWTRLSIEKIHELAPALHQMYTRLATKANFNMVWLPEGYFTGLADTFPDRFCLQAGFRGRELVCFYTTIRNGETLEAHYLGYKADVNHRYQLYLNMLLRIIERGIEYGISDINFARTALTIKSSIGATPTPYHLYLRAANGIANKLLPVFTQFMQPDEAFEARHPFKVSEPVPSDQ